MFTFFFCSFYCHANILIIIYSSNFFNKEKTNSSKKLVILGSSAGLMFPLKLTNSYTF